MWVPSFARGVAHQGRATTRVAPTLLRELLARLDLTFFRGVSYFDTLLKASRASETTKNRIRDEIGKQGEHE